MKDIIWSKFPSLEEGNNKHSNLKVSTTFDTFNLNISKNLTTWETEMRGMTSYTKLF